MALDVVERRIRYTGNGSVKAFAFDFVIFSSEQITVRWDASGVDTAVPRTDYTVSLNADQSNNPGGQVLFDVAPAAGVVLALISAVPYDQPMVLTAHDGFNPEILNDNADLQCAQIQQLKEELDRSVKIPATSESTADELRDALLVGQQYSKTIADNIGAVTSAGQLAPEIRVIAGDITGSVDASWNHDFGEWGQDDTDITLPGGGNIVKVAQNIDKIDQVAKGIDEAIAKVDEASAKLSKTILVTDFGAKGDGITDDTEALNAAVQAAAGKTLVIPAGTYLTTTGIAIPSNTEVRGDGMWATTIKLHPSSPKKTHCVRNSENNWDRTTASAYLGNGGNSNIVLRDICVDGNCWETSDSGYSGCAIQLANVHHTRIENVRAINGKLHCIDICSNAYAENNNFDWYVGASSDVSIINCVAYDSRNDDAITTHFSHDITILNPSVYRTRPLVSDTTHGIEIDDGSYRVHVLGGHVENHNMGIQVKAHQSQRFAPHDIVIDGVTCRQNLWNFAVTHNGGDTSNYPDDAYCRNIQILSCTSVTPTIPQNTGSVYATMTYDLYMHTIGGARVEGFKVVGDDSSRAGGIVADGSVSTYGSIYFSRVYQLVTDGIQINNRDAQVGLIYLTNSCKRNTFLNTVAINCADIPVFHFHTSNESGFVNGVQASRASGGTSTVIDATATTLDGVCRVYRSGYASDLVDNTGTKSIGVAGHKITVV